MLTARERPLVWRLACALCLFVGMTASGCGSNNTARQAGPPVTTVTDEHHPVGDTPIASRIDASACGSDVGSAMSGLNASTTGFHLDSVYQGYAEADIVLSTTSPTPIKFWGGLVDSYLLDSASLQRVGAGQTNYTSALGGVAIAAGQPHDLYVAVPTGGLAVGNYGVLATLGVSIIGNTILGHPCDVLISAEGVPLS